MQLHIIYGKFHAKHNDKTGFTEWPSFFSLLY
jgi:hypothetical protein